MPSKKSKGQATKPEADVSASDDVLLRLFEKVLEGKASALIVDDQGDHLFLPISEDSDEVADHTTRILEAVGTLRGLDP